MGPHSLYAPSTPFLLSPASRLPLPPAPFTLPPPPAPRSLPESATVFCIDKELLYEPFFADFGPLNLGQAYRFCEKVESLLDRAPPVYYVAQAQANFKANACTLLGIYQVMVLGRSAEEAIRTILPFAPFQPYRDASCGPSTFPLWVHDCIRGVERAKKCGFVDFLPLGNPRGFDPVDYEYMEQVEYGDLNWIIPGKILAFGGPQARRTEFYGYRTLVPEDFHQYFREKNVSTVIRLNKRVYDRRRFTDAGLRHFEMYFPDGSCPTENIVRHFLATVETEPGAIAIHCKAGLGRTGVLICCYLGKHYGFTAEEALGYIRVCRPGSVIGPQQHFLKQMQPWLEREAYLMRAAEKVNVTKSHSHSHSPGDSVATHAHSPSSSPSPGPGSSAPTVGDSTSSLATQRLPGSPGSLGVTSTPPLGGSAHANSPTNPIASSSPNRGAMRATTRAAPFLSRR